MKRVAIVGIQGVPANYGGFETLVENIIGENCSEGIEYAVFCSSKDMPERIKEYKGARLKYIPLRANGMQSIFYDMVAMIRSMRKYDTVLVLGVSGCIFLPVFKLLCNKRVIVNIDGLEHRRSKWKGWVQRYLRFSECMAIKFADTIIADNRGIQEYVNHVYNVDTELVTYGGNHVLREISEQQEQEILERYGITPGNYSLSICRIERENNCHMTLEAFSFTNQRLLFIGNWNHNDYSKKLRKKYSKYSNITMLDSIYDLDILHVLRKNARFYIHGHSAGGTNPSLVEAMFFGRPILAYDVLYNNATTFHKANYYKDSQELKALLGKELPTGDEMKALAWEHYTWNKIAKEYEALY